MKFECDFPKDCAQLIQAIKDGKIICGTNTEIVGICPLSHSSAGFLSFSNDTLEETLSKNSIPDGAILVVKSISSDVAKDYPQNITVISDHNPRRWFISAVVQMFIDSEKPPAGIHKLANIEDSVQIGKNVHIGPFVTVESGAIIKDNVSILHGAFIGACCEIGEGSIICANSILGMSGQAIERLDNNEQIKLPHLGKIVIGNDVRIGASCVVVRGSLQDTVIGNTTMIGNLVNIGHNVTIEADCFISANVTIAGSAVIGERSWLAPSSTILNKVRIGQNSMVAMGAVVTKSLPKGAYVFGNPARPIRKINKYNK